METCWEQKCFYNRHKENEKLCFDCGAVGGTMVGHSRETEKQTLDGLVFGYVGFLNILCPILDVIWEP